MEPSKVKDFSRMTVEQWLRLPNPLDQMLFAAPAQKAISVGHGVERTGARA